MLLTTSWPRPQGVGGGAEAARSPAPPASRQRAEVTQVQSHFRRAETRKKLGAAEVLLPGSPLLRCPVARQRGAVGSPGHGAALALRRVRPGASRGLPERPRAGRRAGGGRRSRCGLGCCRPCPRHHEHRRGVPHPAQLPLEQVAGQREAGTARARGRGPALPSPAGRGCPSRRLPPFPRRGRGGSALQVRGWEGTARGPQGQDGAVAARDGLAWHLCPQPRLNQALGYVLARAISQGP